MGHRALGRRKVANVVPPLLMSQASELSLHVGWHAAQPLPSCWGCAAALRCRCRRIAPACLDAGPLPVPALALCSV